MDYIRGSNMSEIQSASDTRLVVSGTVTLHLCIGESHTWVLFCVLDKPVVPVLLRTTFMEKFMKYIHPVERKIMLHLSPPVPNLMVDEANSGPKKSRLDSRQLIDQDPAVLVTPISGRPNYISAARQVVPTAMLKRSDLVSTQAAGLVEVDSHENVAKDNARMTAKRVVDVDLGCPFYMIEANFDKVHVNLAKHHKVREVAGAPVEIVCITNNFFSNPSGAHANNSGSLVSAVHYMLIPSRLKQVAKHEAVKHKNEEKLKNDWHEDVQLHAKFKTHLPALLGMLEEFASMWGGHPGRIDVSKHQIDVINDAIMLV